MTATWILCHDCNDRLVHIAVVVLGEALVGADVSGSEAVDLQLDDAVTGVCAGVLVSNLDVLSFQLERNLKTKTIF